VHPLNQRVEQTLSEWSERRQRLQDASKNLEVALGAYAHGTGPEPTALRAQVEALRAECDQLFNQALSAVAAAKAAGVR
jgi:hypothetical protein